MASIIETPSIIYTAYTQQINFSELTWTRAGTMYYANVPEELIPITVTDVNVVGIIIRQFTTNKLPTPYIRSNGTLAIIADGVLDSGWFTLAIKYQLHMGGGNT